MSARDVSSSRAGDAASCREQTSSSIGIAVRLSGVSISFGDFVAVSGVDLELEEGAFVSLVGPTGCGKSTLLNAITGLRRPQSGTIEIFGKQLRDLNDHSGYMLQQDVLLPWKTTLDNVALGLVFQGVARREARERARSWLDRVGLSHACSRYPHQLSGGMKKRAAMAQTLIMSPRIVLMDEPFGALDVQTRHQMQNELLRLWHEERMTVLFITHDLEEAITLADRVIVMSAGPAARPAADFRVPIARPRDVAEVILTDEYRRVYADTWQVLRDEVGRSNAHPH